MPATPTGKTRPTLALNDDLWRTICHDRGLETEQQQADAIGVHRGTLNRIRNGHYSPSPEFIARVRIAFAGVSTDQLFPIVNRVA